MIRLIKRYGGGSRKLYDTEESRYISLDEIAFWVRQGQELQVVDSATGEDVTAQTLAQVIYEEHKRGAAFLSTGFLHDMIRKGEEALSERVGQIQTGVDRLVRTSVRKLTPELGVQTELGVLRQQLAELERSLGNLEEGKRSNGKGKRSKAGKRARR
jgi:polyhydroxyalkanoate synthesis repressor PhaR